MSGSLDAGRRSVAAPVAFRLLQCAPGVEALYVPALRAGPRVDGTVDQCGPPGSEGRFQSLREAGGIFDVVADSPERFDQLVVPSVLNEASRRRGNGSRSVPVVNAIVVEDQDHDRQAVAADRLDLHSAESKRDIAFDRDGRISTYPGSSYC